MRGDERTTLQAHSSRQRGFNTESNLRIRQVSRLLRKCVQTYARGRKPSRIIPMVFSRPLLIHGSGGCSGFEPDSLLIYSSMQDRLINRLLLSIQRFKPYQLFSSPLLYMSQFINATPKELQSCYSRREQSDIHIDTQSKLGKPKVLISILLS